MSPSHLEAGNYSSDVDKPVLEERLEKSTVFLLVWGMLFSGDWEPSLLGTSLMSHTQAEQNWKRFNREESGRGYIGISS